MPEKIIVGISGSSCSSIGIRLLEIFKRMGVETHLVITETAKEIMEHETSYSVKDVEKLASKVYDNRDLFGSNLTISYTLVRSETLPRKESLTDLGWIPTSWDNIHLLNIYGFREFKGNWQIGFKWRFVGGQPYTPYDEYTSSLVQYWDLTGFGALDYNQYNRLR